MFRIISVIFMFASHFLSPLTTLNVTLSTDNNPGGFGDVGDLRYYLNTMNENLNSGIDDYAITFASPMTITLNGILPIINNSSNSVNITIGNSGSIPTVTIDGNNTYPGFFIPIGNVTIKNMIFQNMVAQGGSGGDGIAGGGGGMGAGAGIYAPASFFDSATPTITLSNVSINSCSAVGGNGGNYLSSSPTGNEGGGGGGGLFGNGGAITTTGTTGGAGGGGFGGNGGDVISADGGGGGGGGIGSRAIMGTVTNLGNGGSDQDLGQNGNGYGLSTPAGSGGGGNAGGIQAGGGGGGNGITSGGGGGGSTGGTDGQHAEGSIPPGGAPGASGGNGSYGGGGGGGAVTATGIHSGFDGKAGTGGYGGGGGGGAGAGASDTLYTNEGGSGGIGGGGGAGGVNLSGSTLADGGNSAGGGGGGGGGPSDGTTASGGQDTGNLGAGAGGEGSSSTGVGFGGGGGGGGSGLGAAIFVDTGLNLTIQAFSGVSTTFTTNNNIVTAGIRGTAGSGGGVDGFDGQALGTSIFLRAGSSLTLRADDANDLLTLTDQVAFVDDTSFGTAGTNLFVRGNGTVIYNGTTNYEGSITINNANFKVNGTINSAGVSVCRDIGFSAQRGTLSGSGSLTGAVLANSGAIYPDDGGTLTLGSLHLNSAIPGSTLGSLVHIAIDADGTSLVSVTGAAILAGILEFDLDSTTPVGSYTVLTSSGITGTFDSVQFTGTTPNYRLSYLPAGSPTFVQIDFEGFLIAPTNFVGKQKKSNFGLEYELYNQLTWKTSTASRFAGYYLYRDDEKIATLDAFATSYQDHNRPRGVFSVYSLVTFDTSGNTSQSVNVTVRPR
ncbi:hypothetical protein KBB68_00715 [Candidatus Babeliales bacterium]|nr:hypothetical protein [Candidatus Babeliales bacterium]